MVSVRRRRSRCRAGGLGRALLAAARLRAAGFAFLACRGACAARREAFTGLRRGAFAERPRGAWPEPRRGAFALRARGACLVRRRAAIFGAFFFALAFTVRRAFRLAITRVLSLTVSV